MTWSVTVTVEDGTPRVALSGDVKDGVYSVAGHHNAEQTTVTTQAYMKKEKANG